MAPTLIGAQVSSGAAGLKSVMLRALRTNR